MRFQLISAGDYNFFDEPSNKGGLIAGKVIAVNPKGEEVSRPYKKFHTGKTNKYDVLAKLILELIPPNEEEETENNETNDTEKELGNMDTEENSCSESLD